jgi:hydrogenase maturation protease
MMDAVPPPILILGLGNDLISDDGFGPAVASACREPFQGRADVSVEAAPVAGFHLLDLLSGRKRVLIVDVVQTGARPPGTLLEWPIQASAAGRTLGGSHQADLPATLEFGRRLGYDLPDAITLLVVEAEDLVTLREELTPEVAAAVPRAVSLALEWAGRGKLAALGC